MLCLADRTKYLIATERINGGGSFLKDYWIEAEMWFQTYSETHTTCVKHTPKSEKIAFNLCQTKCYLLVCLLKSAGWECRTSGSLEKEHPTAGVAHESQLCRESFQNKWKYKLQMWKCNFAGLLDGKPLTGCVPKECSTKFKPPPCSPCGHAAVRVSVLK